MSNGILVRRRDGSTEPIYEDKINQVIQEACYCLHGVSWSDVALGSRVSWYDGITTAEIDESTLLSARVLIEQHPNYAFVAARLLLRILYQHVFGPQAARESHTETLYRSQFEAYLQRAVKEERLHPDLLNYDLPRLSAALEPDRDNAFQFQGIQILSDRYLIRDNDQTLLELPQWFWMRVAMGLALKETGDREAHVIRFYRVMSAFYYIPSTPTLFSAGTLHPQLSSCYLNTVEDSLEGIFKTYTDNARLSKWAGGIGTDWTPVRATGLPIKGTNGHSQGVVPWLRIDNDVALAVNQGGKRKGAHCVYLETWHLDIEDFLELRKNVGDERRRTHDINTANWIPDLFMKRVLNDAPWTLFSPDEVPELHELYGQEFELAYTRREQDYAEGNIRGKTIAAKALWRKMLSMLFETGHPWITFKDACNVRSPQSHVGVIHSSNLCTEITLNTSRDETAVCNLGSINLDKMIDDGDINIERLKQTIQTAVRMLDNVIDINYYPTVESQMANLRHRAIGLGVMGYQDALYQLGMPFNSQAHLDWADQLFERLSYETISASNALARERGSYASFTGSKWAQGIFPLDTLNLLQTERGEAITVNRQAYLDWASLKQSVRQFGLRNANLMAIAPTATISNIIGTTPCIEPAFKNLYVASNLSGEFTQINHRLVADLEAQGLWSPQMVAQLKAADGQLSRILGMPEPLNARYPDIFEIDQTWLIRAAAVRGKWIDQAQSLNLFVAQPSGKALHQLYVLAWRSGLKTTYYLRSLAASQVEKATVDTTQFGPTHQRPARPVPQTCAITDPTCDACQ